MIGAMKRLAKLSILLLVVLFSPLSSQRTAASPPPPVIPQAPISAVERAIQAEITIQQELVLAYIIYDTKIDVPNYSEDGIWAAAQLIPLDRQTGSIVPAEPGLALAQNMGGSWLVYLP